MWNRNENLFCWKEGCHSVGTDNLPKNVGNFAKDNFPKKHKRQLKLRRIE
jgi:hypothetical protein